MVKNGYGLSGAVAHFAHALYAGPGRAIEGA